MGEMAEKWREIAKRDDALDDPSCLMVPGDIRAFVAEIDELERALDIALVCAGRPISFPFVQSFESAVSDIDVASVREDVDNKRAELFKALRK